MANELNIHQRQGNAGYTNRKIIPAANQVLGFDANSKLVAQDRSLAPKQILTANGAITVPAGPQVQVVILDKAGVLAATLAPPAAAQEGTVLFITSKTANAHTVTLTEGFNNGGASTDVATFGGAIGDGLTIIAVNLHWNVQNLRNVTLA